jgi:protein-L-isoaspartate(D-aspartate) O-methyltransferase
MAPPERTPRARPWFRASSTFFTIGKRPGQDEGAGGRGAIYNEADAAMSPLPWLVALTAFGCRTENGASDAALARAREEMVESQIAARGVKDERTLAAMRRVPRHLFVPEGYAREAYDDHPLPIGHGQTISQPYIVAFMTEALHLSGGETVLEVGTGSGYQSAVLSGLVAKVYSVEIVEPLAREAAERLKRLGYDNVEVRAGDGYRGWPEAAPFDAIVVTAAAPRVPEPLKQQLRDGGRLLLPIGDEWQELVLVKRRGDAFEQTQVLPVRFVPMTGRVRQ